MEKNMEATIVYWSCIGIMEKKMEATIVGCSCSKKLGLGLRVSDSIYHSNRSMM